MSNLIGGSLLQFCSRCGHERGEIDAYTPCPECGEWERYTATPWRGRTFAQRSAQVALYWPLAAAPALLLLVLFIGVPSKWTDDLLVAYAFVWMAVFGSAYPYTTLKIIDATRCEDAMRGRYRQTVGAIVVLTLLVMVGCGLPLGLFV